MFQTLFENCSDKWRMHFSSPQTFFVLSFVTFLIHGYPSSCIRHKSCCQNWRCVSTRFTIMFSLVATRTYCSLVTVGNRCALLLLGLHFASYVLAKPRMRQVPRVLQNQQAVCVRVLMKLLLVTTLFALLEEAVVDLKPTNSLRLQWNKIIEISHDLRNWKLTGTSNHKTFWQLLASWTIFVNEERW